MSVITLGCRLNAAEAEAARLEGVTLVNTCAVTAEAAAQSRRAAAKAGREGPVVVTGCAAELDPAAFAALPGVRSVLPNSAKWDWLADAPPPLAHTRGFVAVQTGCDHDCTFCVTRIARGPARSLPASAVTATVRRMVDAGVAEVVLTGVDLTSWGSDLAGSPRLGTLVQRILAEVPELARLRLSSLDSIEIDEALFEVVTGEARMMPHLHLSLQSGDDLILRRMKRRHRRADAARLCDRLLARRPGLVLGADLIAGFPTEDDAAFANTLALLDDCGLSLAHVFAYSPRDGTAAARMPQLPAEVRRDRAARLRAAAGARRDAWLASEVGRVQRVLVERGGRSGRSEGYAPVQLNRAASRGAVVEAVAVRAGDGLLECDLL